MVNCFYRLRRGQGITALNAMCPMAYSWTFLPSIFPGQFLWIWHAKRLLWGMLSLKNLPISRRSAVILSMNALLLHLTVSRFLTLVLRIMLPAAKRLLTCFSSLQTSPEFLLPAVHRRFGR